jgi:hypothetical protein
LPVFTELTSKVDRWMLMKPDRARNGHQAAVGEIAAPSAAGAAHIKAFYEFERKTPPSVHESLRRRKTG